MNEYSKERRNYIRSAKKLMARGYEIEDYEPPKTIKELGHQPTSEDILNIKEQKITLTEKAYYTEKDEYGHEKRVPYSERIKYERSQWARHKTTKTPKLKDDRLPPTHNDYPVNDAEVIAKNFKDILKILSFKSIAKQSSKRRRNEDIVHGIGLELYELLESESNKDAKSLAERLQNNSMAIESIYMKAEHAYLEPDNGASLPELYKEYITGVPTTVSEAKSFDDGYDEMDEDDILDELPF